MNSRTRVPGIAAGMIPRIPEKGTVGASGDLAPLSHLALACLGEGEFWNAEAHAWLKARSVRALDARTRLDSLQSLHIHIDTSTILYYATYIMFYGSKISAFVARTALFCLFMAA